MRIFKSAIARLFFLIFLPGIFHPLPSVAGGFVITKKEEFKSSAEYFCRAPAGNESILYLNYAGSDGDNDDSYIGSFEMDYTRKSPLDAFLLGFFPGSVIHGLGHFYIGDKKSGNGLLFTEFASIALMLPVAQTANSMIGGTRGSAISKMCKGFGATLFVISWISDFANAPLKAAKLNRKYYRSINIEPKLNNDMASINLTIAVR